MLELLENGQTAAAGAHRSSSNDPEKCLLSTEGAVSEEPQEANACDLGRRQRRQRMKREFGQPGRGEALCYRTTGEAF